MKAQATITKDSQYVVHHKESLSQESDKCTRDVLSQGWSRAGCLNQQASEVFHLFRKRTDKS